MDWAKLLELITTLAPIIGQVVTAILSKKKGDFAAWARDGAKAHAAAKDPRMAFWLGSLACMADNMSDADYAAMKPMAVAAMKAVQQQAAATVEQGPTISK